MLLHQNPKNNRMNPFYKIHKREMLKMRSPSYGINKREMLKEILLTKLKIISCWQYHQIMKIMSHLYNLELYKSLFKIMEKSGFIYYSAIVVIAWCLSCWLSCCLLVNQQMTIWWCYLQILEKNTGHKWMSQLD